MSRVSLAEVRRFCIDCMTAVGTLPAHAVALADVLIEADRRGHYSHGINRLDMYVRDVKSKTCEGSAVPSILKETLGTAWVDGNNALGPVVGNFCMDVAIKKAKDCGIGWVVAKGSNHYGIAAWYSMQALKCNMLGMSFTNTSPLMSPTRSKHSALGTNPISFAAPAKDGGSFVLDMATTAVAVGKIEVQRRKNEPIPVGWAQGPDGKPTTDADLAFKTSALMPLGGEERTSGFKGYGLALMVETFCGILAEVQRRKNEPIPVGWAQGPDGKPTTDADLAFKTSALMPLGGEERTSGFKGYGLALMVETFCGILAGGDFGPNIRKWMDGSRPANLGQCFVAIDPECFAPGFELRMSDMMCALRNLEPSDPDRPVLVPGDPERNNTVKVDEEGGVLYHENQLRASAELAKELNVKPMQEV